MSNKNIFIGLMVAGGGLVAYALWKKKQKQKQKGIVWKPGDDPLVVTSDDGSLLEGKMPEMSKKDLLAQYGIYT